MTKKRILREKHEGLLVNVWSLPLIYEGQRGDQYVFRMPFSDKEVTENVDIELVDGAIEFIEDFDNVRSQYVQNLSSEFYELFRGSPDDLRGRHVFTKDHHAFTRDIHTLEINDVRLAYLEAIDRIEAEHVKVTEPS